MSTTRAQLDAAVIAALGITSTADIAFAKTAADQIFLILQLRNSYEILCEELTASNITDITAEAIRRYKYVLFD
jgi:hypothetical protein